MKRSGDEPTLSSSSVSPGDPSKKPKKFSYWKMNCWSKRGAFDIDKIHESLEFSSNESSTNGESSDGSTVADNSKSDLDRTLNPADVDVELYSQSDHSVQSSTDSSASSFSDSGSDYGDDSASTDRDSNCEEGEMCIPVPVESDDDPEILSSPVNCHQQQPQVLHSFTETTVNETVLGVMDSFLGHNKSKSCLQTDFETSVSTHYCCHNCQFYYGTSKIEVCPDCENKQSIEFHILDIVDQIRFLFEQRGLGDVLKKAEVSRNVDSNVITDITDGSEYKRVNPNRSEFDVTVILSVDGASIKKSSKANFWPITFTIAEIPAAMRHLYISCVGVWYASKKPEINIFFRAVCVRLKMLKKEGELQWTDPKTGEQLTSRISAPLIIAYAPARADLLNMHHHNGRYGCNTCEVKTTRVRRVDRERRRRVYKFAEEFRPRTKERLRVFGKEADKSDVIIKGVKGRTVRSLLPGVDKSTVVFGKFMHAVCLGVIKQVLQLWTSKPGRWSLKQLISDLDKCMESIKVPSSFSRFPRKVSESSFWKAYEYLYWGLFYSQLVFSSVLAESEWFEPFQQHWMLFVKAIHILMQGEIRIDDLQEAETLLKMFIKDFESLYGEKELTYNVHQMLHLCLNVRRWGPMYLTSAFPFENFIGRLGKTVHGNKNVGKEITQKIRLSQGVEVLRATVEVQRRTSNKNECLGKAVDVTSNPDVLDFFRSLGLSEEKLQIFARAEINGCIFTSLIYKEVGTIDYCVHCCYNENSVVIGKIKQFYKYNENVFVVIEPLSVDQEKIMYRRETQTTLDNILPVKSVGDLIVINVNDVISMTNLLLHDHFVCAIPEPLRSKRFIM